MFCSVAKDVSPPAAAEQVKVRAYLGERVTRGINAVNPWDWVEDDLPPLRRLLVDAGGQSYCPEGNLRAVCRPRRRSFSYDGLSARIAPGQYIR
jgi:hypothetical protein